MQVFFPLDNLNNHFKFSLEFYLYLSNSHKFFPHNNFVLFPSVVCLQLTLFNMDFLPGSFVVFQVVGLWRSPNIKSSIYNNFYRLRTFFSVFLLYSFVGCSIIGIAIKHDDVKTVTNDCFVMLSVLACCGKSVNILKCRKTILNIIEIMQNDPCSPRNEHEIDIQKKCDSFIWINTVIYGILTEVTAVMLTFGTLFIDLPEGELPFNTWLPYNHSHGFTYKFAHGQQIISIMTSANIAIAYDTLVPAMILQVCAKLNILKHRFSNFTKMINNQINKSSTSIDKLKKEKQLIADYVKCHLIIFKLAKTINNTFSIVVFLQCLISTLVLCVSIYNLASVELFSSEFTNIILYLACMLSEIFILCAAGNEVTLVSQSISDSIYETDWTDLNTSTIKSLVLIMSRTMKPIIFKSGYVIELSLDSFKSLVKISYSTYNVLQQTS
uniref:Odorant receptor n=1 Tax=Aphidius gifuensis TaxID=684658 RepID=A0A3S5HSS6_APHGI|nr:odorant receptor [Aphidius gifuensis]